MIFTQHESFGRIFASFTVSVIKSHKKWCSFRAEGKLGGSCIPHFLHKLPCKTSVCSKADVLRGSPAPMERPSWWDVPADSPALVPASRQYQVDRCLQMIPAPNHWDTPSHCLSRPTESPQLPRQGRGPGTVTPYRSPGFLGAASTHCSAALSNVTLGYLFSFTAPRFFISTLKQE